MPESVPSGTPERFIVDKVFARNRLHLIFGPPRSGVSTLLLQTMWEWANGRDVFGHASYPTQYCYIDAIRPFDELKAHLADLMMPAAEIPHTSLMETTTHEDRTIDAMLGKPGDIMHRCPVIFLDGLQSLFHGNTIFYRDVLNFHIDLAKICAKRKLTIIATMDTAKASEGSDIPIVQRIIGSIAWTRNTGTMVHISPQRGQDLKPERTVTIFPPRRPPIELEYRFNDSGALEYAGGSADSPEMTLWLSQIAPGSTVETKEVIDAGALRDVKKRTIERWMSEQVELGALTRLQRGMYRKPPDSGGVQ